MEEQREALRQTLAGNKDAYGYFVRTYHRNLYYYVAGKIPNECEAEDVVQKALVTAYCKLHEFQPEESFAAWLRGIALNHCRDIWRQHQRQAELKERLLEYRRAELNLTWLAEPQQDQDRLAALRTCMRNLSEDEQRAVRLRFIEERPLADIGAELDKNAEAVRQFLFRIRTRLGTCIKKRLALGGAAL